MIVRIVRMRVIPESRSEYLRIVNQSLEAISRYPGCHHLRLYTDAADSNCFITESEWDDEAALEDYRNSTLFNEILKQVKPLFAAPAEAFSMKPLAV